MSDLNHERFRDNVKKAQSKMRDAFDGLRSGRYTPEEANERFFDGHEELNGAVAAWLLTVEVKEAAASIGEREGTE